MKLADMSVEYLDHMGSDLTVVNAARVSFHKEHSEFDNATDRGLISYLARHNHWSPFAHCSASFRVKAPIFVARQLVKHTVGFSWNEVSRRYVADEPEFFLPDALRLKAANVKQGSSEEILPYFMEDGFSYYEMLEGAARGSLKAYEMLLQAGVCPEQARMILPQNTMTEWIWSGTLFAWARMCKLRLDSHTQKETREIAEGVASNMANLFPVSWEFLIDNEAEKPVCALLKSH